MATTLTTKTKLKAASVIQEPQLVLQIDGVTEIFGLGEVKKYIRIGDPGLLIGDSWVIGGLNGYENQLDVIDLNGSSNTISQQLLQDKGGTTSVPSIQVSLIDKNQRITELITPGVVVEDILGRKANVYLGYQDTAWPQDFIRIFAGIVDEVVGGTTIVLNVAHPEQKKRAEIFPKITTELTQDLYYRAKNIQHILYQTRRDVVGTVTVTYVSGATLGSEVVSVVGTNITVQIAAGSTTAKHIRDKIERSIDALSLVDIKVDSDFSNFVQSIQATTSLDSDLTINVVSTKGMLLPAASEGFRTYVRINDEVIEYTGMTDTTLTGCTRGALATVDERAEGASHEAEDTVDTFYRLEGNAIEMALKVLMSGGDQFFASGVDIKSIGYVEGIGVVPNSVWFENLNVQDAYGITAGDKCSIVGDVIPGNNVTLATISDIVITEFGSYLILDSVSLTTQTLSDGTISFASKWNVLPTGAGLQMGGDEVDVPEFERIRDTFASSIHIYDFYLKDTVSGKEFVDTEILFPTGGFTLPRRGKISAGYNSPPLGNADLKVLDSTNTTKPGQTKIKRSINKYFYNNVLFRYNEAVVDEKFLSGDLDVNEDSKSRIPVGNKTLVINARGLRPSGDSAAVIEILKRRFQDKYKFGAELVTLYSFYGDTFDTDTGDVVLFGDSTLGLPDTKRGSRNFSPRLFEVQNKSLSIKTGEVKLDILDSGYSLSDGRYGIVSPSSLCVAAGSSGSSVKIKNSFETFSGGLEKSKWTPYVGQRVIIHDENWDNIHETKLLGFAAADNFLMLLEDPVPFAVFDDYIVDIAQYPDNANPEDQRVSKTVFVFTNPTVEILSASSQTQFTVSGLDASKFVVGNILLVRDEAWDVVSPEVRVDLVVGSTITVSAPLGFVPLAGYEVDLIGFKDGGSPYRFL